MKEATGEKQANFEEMRPVPEVFLVMQLSGPVPGRDGQGFVQRDLLGAGAAFGASVIDYW